jgi:nucleotide-binding universal stress UspA family protein
MIQHILFPVDFSKAAEEAGSVVQAWARSFGAQVTMLHVCEGSGLVAEEQRLKGFLVDGFEGVKLKRLQMQGAAADAIVRYSAANSVDLILMPTLGYTRFRQLLLGSVTAGVLHDSLIPVWTSPHVASPSVTEIPKQIVCAVDCGSETATVVQYAQGLANKFEASLKVMHSSPAIPGKFDSAIAQRAHHFALQRAREDYEAAIASLRDKPALEIVEDATLVEGVRRVVEQENADLLVIGRGKIQGYFGRLRSNAHDLIRMAGCPVLSV